MNMKRFLVFWDSANDQEDVAQGYADEALVHAKQTKKAIGTKLVDINNTDLDKKYWDSPSTIECVTVDGTTKKDTAFNPDDSEIDGMVDNL
jgi:hypothetical protein